jgi:hypothetical protein
MHAKTNQHQVIIRGDIVIDWNITESTSGQPDAWSPNKHASVSRARGGALLLADLLQACIKDSKVAPVRSAKIDAVQIDLDQIVPGDPHYHHACNLLTAYPTKGGETWRVTRFLGFDRRSAPEPAFTPGQAASDCSVLVLDDANLGFRQERKAWLPLLETLGNEPWILIKQAAPVADGELWDELIRNHAERTIVLTTIEDLRRSEVQISRQISWERTAQDVFWELTHNPRVNSLSRPAYCIISLNAAGAILFSHRPDATVKATLLFDPDHMECEMEDTYPGAMYGYSTCLAAAIARAIIADPQSLDLIAAIQSGVRGARSLLTAGFEGGNPVKGEDGFHIPFETIVKAFDQPDNILSAAPVQNPVQNLVGVEPASSPRIKPGYWTLLEDRYTRDLNQVAQQIILEGVDAALQDVPVGRFGALKTVDRREIEALHSVRTLISEYLSRPQVRPLSIAVFGPPGSGKSFAVKQIAKSSTAGSVQAITFNISQFDHPSDLIDALHQVRDIALSGATPLVFWDEFDTPYEGKALGWLRYFLAPMQDGTFQEGQITHPIGKSIFVFAGGTSHCMQDFGLDLEEPERRAAKLPDFISRLKGFLDILGPNPIEGLDDPYFILRRAIVLRVLFEMHVPQIVGGRNWGKRVRIDPGILRAFLETKRYKHGVRSMETLLTMSTLAEATSFDRSCLPPEDQLNLHVDGTDFLARVQQLDLEDETLERLARAAHEVFCEGLTEQGYTYAPVTDRERKTHRALISYDELNETLKESNRANVRDIPNKLALAGYAMLPARSNEPPFNFPGPDLETLARLEHERWMESMRQAGWGYGPELDEQARTHPAIVNWEELNEDEREKDRQMVRSIPRILARAGYAVVHVQNGG